jgi:hypothetical protein
LTINKKIYTLSKRKNMQKKILRSEDLYIQFSREELDTLNIKEGDKFSWTEAPGGFLLQKFVPLEINLQDFDRETLEMLISLSIEKDIPINDVINDIIENFIKTPPSGKQD